MSPNTATQQLLLLENLTTAVLLLDSQQRVLYMNMAAETMLDRSGRRAANDLFSAMFAGHFSALASLQADIRSADPSTRRAITLPLTSGREITVDMAITPVELEGEVSVLLELQSIDRILRISREENQASSQSISQRVIQGLAHEIKNPLGGVRGAAQLLAKELDDDALRDYTDVIIEEADRLRKLVDRMLGPNKALDLQVMNIHQALERVCTLIHTEVGPDVEIVRDYDPSIPDLSADAEQLIQACLNIMRNATQALAGMGFEHNARVTVRSRVIRQFTIGQHCHRLVVAVEFIDNGPGIDAELLERIFFPLVSGHAEGTGLGLSIAQSIVHRHNGLLECRSEPGNTVFSIYLPLETI